MEYMFIYLIVLNIIGFLIMGFDKWLAIHNRSRVREATLFTTAFIGGSVGVYLGMFAFRHKTKHLTFLIFVPVCIMLNAFLIIYLFKTNFFVSL